MLVEVVKHDLVLVVFGHLVDLVHGINESFEFMFADLALLDKGSFSVACDGAVPLRYALIKVLDELSVSPAELVVPVVVVERQGVTEDAWNILEVVVDFCDMIHGLELQIHLNDRDRQRVLLLGHFFDLRFRLLHSLRHCHLSSIFLH